MAMVRASCSVLILAHTIICTGAFVPTSGPPCHSSELLSSCSLGCCLPATKPLVLRSTSTRGRADLVSLRASEDEKDGDFEAFFAEQKALAQRGKASAGPVAVGDVLKNEGQDWTVVAERKRERSSKVRTYDAIDNSNQQRVLIKALSLRDMAGAWDVLDDLKREARLLKSVRHSGIPARIDDFENDSAEDRTFLLILERPDAVSLEEALVQGWRPTEAEVVSLAEGVLEILDFLAQLRPPVSHSTLSPARIHIGAPGSAQGGARRVWVDGFCASSSERAAALAGGYLPPSAQLFSADGSNGSPAEDLYSLGAVLLRVLSGQETAVFRDPRSGTLLFRGRVFMNVPLAEWLERIVAARESGERFSSPRQARAALAVLATAPAQTDLDVSQPSSVAVANGLTTPARRPAGTRVEIREDGGTLLEGGSLEVVIPAAGVTGSTVATGAFSIAWTAGIGTWTAAALVGAPIMAAFSIPFWLVGANLVKDTVKSVAVGTRLRVSSGRFELVQQAGNYEVRRVDGEARDLTECSVATVGYVNGVPMREVQLVEGINVYSLGGKGALDMAEQEWIASRIRAFLEFQ